MDDIEKTRELVRANLDKLGGGPEALKPLWQGQAKELCLAGLEPVDVAISLLDVGVAWTASVAGRETTIGCLKKWIAELETNPGPGGARH